MLQKRGGEVFSITRLIYSSNGWLSNAKPFPLFLRHREISIRKFRALCPASNLFTSTPGHSFASLRPPISFYRRGSVGGRFFLPPLRPRFRFRAVLFRAPSTGRLNLNYCLQCSASFPPRMKRTQAIQNSAFFIDNEAVGDIL